MRWKRETTYNLVSDCGRYRITKNETARGWVYALNDGKQVLAVGDLDTCKAKAREVGK